MLRQIKILCGMALKTSFGFNEMKYSNDKKKRNQFIFVGIAMVFLLLYVLAGIAGISIIFATKKAPELIPIFIATCTSLICFIFTLVKSGDLIFNLSDYESIIPLPVKPTAIIISRFLTAYILDAVFSFLVMFPGAFIYAFFEQPGAVFYITMVIGTLLLPLIPMTLGSAINSGILAALSRFRYRKVLNIIVAVAFSIFVILGSFAFSFQININSAEMLNGNLHNSDIVRALTGFGNYYIPVKLFSDGAVNNNIVYFLLFVLLSAAVFALYIFIFGKNFKKVSSALAASATKKKFVADTQKMRSPLKALYMKELKALFSSSTYLLNCGIGYVMAGIFGVAVSFFLPERMRDPDFLSVLKVAAPLVIAFCVVISPTTCCSFSFEGKHLWILQSLPIKNKTVINSKFLVNLTVAIPFYLIAVICLIATMNYSPAQILYTIVVPLAFIVFSSIIGLRVDMKSPTLNWSKEAEAIKQNVSVLYTMLWGFLAVVVSIVPVVFLGAYGYLIVSVLLIVLSILFYSMCIKKPLKSIGE